ncbi:hypothetical protein KW807_02795, partial [Candidatus Parcubacteria bacterium]|nr:hypothetical protein [Candidatus Parcubacteria bacterium]
GVTLEKVDDKTVAFHLKRAYAPFIYNLATGILPRHIWKNVSNEEFPFSQYNTLPVGSGPYKITKVEQNQGGIPDYYELSPFKDGMEREAYVRKLLFRFYTSEVSLIDAYNQGEVQSLGGISPESMKDLKTNDANVIHSPLPRIFAVFFNESHSKVLLNKEVRQALDLVSPKEEIVDEVLDGFGTPIDGPLPAGLYHSDTQSVATSSKEVRLAEAKKLLTDAGWTANPETGILEKKSKSDTISLSFSISTGDAPELRAVADKLREAWGQLGAKIDVLVFETGDLNQNVIRPRQFDALLFGEVVSRGDVYPFWHSSQRNDPGLNISLYANPKVDKALEELRSTTDQEVINKDYEVLNSEIRKDIPAVFLYTPSFVYVVPKSVKDLTLGPLAVPQDRFLGIRDWYIETDKVWGIFLN